MKSTIKVTTVTALCFGRLQGVAGTPAHEVASERTVAEPEPSARDCVDEPGAHCRRNGQLRETGEIRAAPRLSAKGTRVSYPPFLFPSSLVRPTSQQAVSMV